MADKHALNVLSSESNEWYTPQKYIESARLVMNTIDLDPASSDEANKIVKATSYYTKDTDGLSHRWEGNVFLNPPYGKSAKLFVHKLLIHYYRSDVFQAILLLNSNATDTKWFAPLWNHTLCFTDHRIDFISGDGTGTKCQSTHGSVFVYLGDNYKRFAREFQQYGYVVQCMVCL